MKHIPTHALTLRQPWAHLVIHGNKDVENRSWDFPKPRINQWIWLHAGKAYESGISDIPKTEMTFAAIIGAVKFKGSSLDHPSEWAIDGQYHWAISAKIALPKPVPCKGDLGFWLPSSEVQHQLSKEWEIVKAKR